MAENAPRSTPEKILTAFAAFMLLAAGAAWRFHRQKSQLEWVALPTAAGEPLSAPELPLTGEFQAIIEGKRSAWQVTRVIPDAEFRPIAWWRIGRIDSGQWPVFSQNPAAPPTEIAIKQPQGRWAILTPSASAIQTSSRTKQ